MHTPARHVKPIRVPGRGKATLDGIHHQQSCPGVSGNILTNTNSPAKPQKILGGNKPLGVPASSFSPKSRDGIPSNAQNPHGRETGSEGRSALSGDGNQSPTEQWWLGTRTRGHRRARLRAAWEGVADQAPPGLWDTAPGPRPLKHKARVAEWMWGPPQSSTPQPSRRPENPKMALTEPRGKVENPGSQATQQGHPSFHWECFCPLLGVCDTRRGF